ncbi:choice-of-anchor G family protein [Frigoribacterium sp. PhB160]|uniref:choice-of-anchor G family protein n=1 Tax=Frigoribacterium sp. PhB160 TaxID=2485192 RepID=UPI000F465125|nr:choice-of-anchor G family protein [Frigoribacterium sp. PhB160]
MAVVTAALLGLGGSVLAASPALAAPPASTGEGRFLGGSALGLDLDDLVALETARAVNTGGDPVTDVTPLDATVLNAVEVDLGSGIELLGPNGLLTLGAVNQFAQASPDGSSTAASGAVTNAGAVGVGGAAGVPQADAAFDLSGLVGDDVAGSLANLTLDVGSVSATAAQAAGPDGAQTGDYGIASLALTLDSPALSATTADLRAALAALQPTVDGVDDLLGALGPLVTVDGIPTLVDALDSATAVTTADGSITADLQTGAITVDVAAVLAAQGLDLNDLAPGTDLLPYVTDALTAQLLPALSSALQGVADQLTASLTDLDVTVAGVPVPVGTVLGVVSPVIDQVVAPISDVLADLGATVVTPLVVALDGVVAIEANTQSTTADGVFTQGALRVSLLGGAATPLAVVELASAAVGPNAGPLAVPTLVSLDPDQGPVTGGTPVTITGTDFTDDSTVSVDGSDPIAPTVVSDDGTSLTFTTPAHAVGPVDVTVTSPAGTSGPLTFTYVPVDGGGDGDVPTLVSLDPDQGPVTGGTAVTITGTDFTDDSTVSVDGSDPIAPTVVSDDGTSLTFTTPAHAVGPVDVTVTSPAGTSGPLTFTYVPVDGGGDGDGDVPTLLSLDPDQGPVGGGTLVTITGTDFTPGSTVSVDGSDPITPTSISTDGTTIVFSTPAHVAGGVPVTVTNDAGTSAPLTFTYVAAPAGAPTLTSLDPDQGPVGGGTLVTITGTGFTPGSTVSVDGSAPITPTAVSTDGTTITFTTPAHVAGAVPVTVTNGSGTSAPLTYTYVGVGVTPPPVITSPEDGEVVDTPTPVITGTGTPGSTVTVTIGTGVVCTALVVTDGTWSCSPVLPLPTGEVTIVATESGPLGTSEPSAPVTFTVGSLVDGGGLGADPGDGTTPGGNGGNGGAGGNGGGFGGGAGNGNGGGFAGNGALAYTGTDSAPILAFALVLMVVGGVMTIRRRQQRD